LIGRWRDTLRAAFVRGRRSAKIVAHPYEQVFSMSVEDARRALVFAAGA
jgi:hypothetical protein